MIKEVEIIKIEVVVRNVEEGQIEKKIGIEEGKIMKRQIIEL